MAADSNFLLLLTGAVVFLAALVWLMVRAASQPQWREVSAGVRTARNAAEKKKN